MKDRQKIFVATRSSPIPGEQGSASYLFDILEYLKNNGFRIHVCWTQHNDFIIKHGWFVVPRYIDRVFTLSLPGSISLGRLKIFPRKWLLPAKARWMNRIKKFLKILGLFSILQSRRKRQRNANLDTSIEPQWSGEPSMDEINYIKFNVKRYRPGIVIANYAWMNAALSKISELNDCFRLVICPDVWHQLIKLKNKKLVIEEIDSDEVSLEKEKCWLNDCHAIAAISEEDAGYFRGMFQDKNIIVTPKAMSVKSVSRHIIPGRCLFVASLAFFNVSGLQWFLKNIWPVIIKSDPEATLHVCGTICKSFSENYQGVTFKGVVNDLEHEYGEAEVVILPLLEGRGVKTKLVEACSYSKACVTTSIGLHGISFLIKGVVLADTVDDFSKAIINLLSNQEEREKLGSRACQLVKDNLSLEQCYGPLFQQLEKKSACYN